MPYRHLHCQLVRLSHRALVGEEDISVFVLVEDDAVAASLLGSFNLLSQLAHGDKSSLCHDLLNVELGDGSLFDRLPIRGLNRLLKLLSQLFFAYFLYGEVFSALTSCGCSVRALCFDHVCVSLLVGYYIFISFLFCF